MDLMAQQDDFCRSAIGRQGLTRTDAQHLRCNAAGEPEVASQKELDAIDAGEIATPRDPAGQPILGEEGNRSAGRTQQRGRGQGAS